MKKHIKVKYTKIFTARHEKILYNSGYLNHNVTTFYFPDRVDAEHGSWKRNVHSAFRNSRTTPKSEREEY